MQSEDGGVKVSAIILALNEQIHLRRCIASLREVASDVLVVDCFSTDRTVEIARECGARVVQRRWTSYADQFNWAIGQLPADSVWVLRIDADEYLTPELTAQLSRAIADCGAEVDGINCGRRMAFQGRLIRHGGVFPIRVLRLFRYNRGRCERRWMDEHIKVEGRTIGVSGEIIDDNLNSLTWWTAKHNGYASREAVDLLNLEFGFMARDTVADPRGRTEAGIKRWIKESVYARLPVGGRAAGYFLYRYFVRLGFLDGWEGLAFHFLQGFWYRFLVDAKVVEVKRCMRKDGVDVAEAIRRVLAIDVATQLA
jgi:glycosyltransferase involved in cell wall biosynthesis